MNLSLIDKVVSLDAGFVATIISTSGHTYQKTGARALFRPGDPFPVSGNLGSLCADQELVRRGALAMDAGRPQRVRIDTTDDGDALTGYGTACGGVMELLIEPLLASHRDVYSTLGERMRSGRETWLVHHVDTGELAIADREPQPDDGIYVECIAPPRRVVIFGATPLALRVHSILTAAGLDVHISDWRPAYLDHLEGAVPPSRRHLDEFPVDARTGALIVSHSFERDRIALRQALEAGCGYIGLLSSTKRRDRIYESLVADGVDASALDRVSCPVGLRTGGGDGEIAVGIAAEILQEDA